MTCLPLPFSQKADNVGLGRVGIVGLKKVNGAELLVEGFALLGREGLCLFRNPFVGCSPFRSELPDEVRTATCEQLRRATCWHIDGVECFALGV